MSVKKLPSSKFTYANSADRHRVFLWDNHDTFPFLRPVNGWKIVGYGKAPWPGSTDGLAVMMEKEVPAEEDTGSMLQKQHTLVPEGERIWIHGYARWVPGLPEFERRLAKREKRKLRTPEQMRQCAEDV